MELRIVIQIDKIGMGERLKALRATTTLSQGALGKLAGTNQSSIDRYEHDRSIVPYRILLWYAEHFDVSLDYLYGRTDDPHGKYYSYQPQNVQEQFKNTAEWEAFIEGCFTDGSPMNRRFKEMLINMASTEQK